jgi:hypothetical protein
MQVFYDNAADSAHINLTGRTDIKRNVRSVKHSADISLEYDRDTGNLSGIEILNASVYGDFSEVTIYAVDIINLNPRHNQRTIMAMNDEVNRLNKLLLRASRSHDENTHTTPSPAEHCI